MPRIQFLFRAIAFLCSLIVSFWYYEDAFLTSAPAFPNTDYCLRVKSAYALFCGALCFIASHEASAKQKASFNKSDIYLSVVPDSKGGIYGTLK